MIDNTELIAQSKEHADSLRVVMQDQAAETIESLCDALEAAKAEVERLNKVVTNRVNKIIDIGKELREALARLAEIEAQEHVAEVERDAAGGVAWLENPYKFPRGTKLYAAAAAGASPQPSKAPACDLRGIDAGPLSEWVDLVRRGYVAKDECLIAVKDVPKWVSKNQPSQARELGDAGVRRKFEIYAAAKGFTLDRYKSPENALYVHYNTQWAWEAYQDASPKAQPSQAPFESRCANCGKDATNAKECISDYPEEGEWFCSSECKEQHDHLDCPHSTHSGYRHPVESKRLIECEEVLRALACYVGNGGYNAPTVEPKVFEEKIRDGIDRHGVSTAQPSQALELSPREIYEIAHRKATRYTSTAPSTGVMYGFSEMHLLYFIAAINAKGAA